MIAAMVRNAGPGNYVDGNGLMLRVRNSGSRQWIQALRPIALAGKRATLRTAGLQSRRC